MPPRTVKALFVTHNYGAYGASKSLQLLLKNNPELDISLVIPRKELLTHENRGRIADFFGIHPGKVMQFFLPWNNCFEGRKTDGLNRSIQTLKNLLWHVNKHRFTQFIKNRMFDFIHLNSLVLCDILSDRYPFIIHVRERVIDACVEAVWRKIKQARGILFIDESVRHPFPPHSHPGEILLTNPVDMTGVGQYVEATKAADGCVVISLIGRIEEGKGVDFIIHSFMKAASDNLRLLIAGDEGDGMKTGYPDFCRRIAAGDKRIVFWGHEPHIDKIYAVSDYIIRGEIDFRMGRSILESLYSDCDVIIPSRETNIAQKNHELRKFPQKIHRYEPRNIEDLAGLFRSIQDRKVGKHYFTSNVKEYVQQYNAYVQRTIY